MPSRTDHCGIPHYDADRGDAEAFLGAAAGLPGGKEPVPERRDLLLRLYSAACRGDHAMVEEQISALDPADPVRKQAVGLAALARFPHLAARYLLPRKWYPALMLHVEPNLALPGLRTGRCGFRLPDDGTSPEPSTIVLGDGYGFDAGLPYGRTLAGRLPGPAQNLSVPEANLVQKLIAFELFAPPQIDTLVVVEGATGLHAALLHPITTYPPIPPLLREEQFHRTFNGTAPPKRKESEQRTAEDAGRAALGVGYEALRTLLRAARRGGVERLLVVAAPRFPAAPAADAPWERHLHRLAQLSGERSDLVAIAAGTAAADTRHCAAIDEICRTEGAAFLDTTTFRAPDGTATFADLHSLTPAAYDLWAARVLDRLGGGRGTGRERRMTAGETTAADANT